MREKKLLVLDIQEKPNLSRLLEITISGPIHIGHDDVIV